MDAKRIADYIFINGKVITVDKEDRVCGGLAIEGNKIIFVGDEAGALQFKGDKTKVIDLAGRSVVPGFIDSHLHTGVMGANSLAIDCRSPQVSSIEDIKKLIAERVKVTPKGEWIRGWGYDHSKLAENRHPNRWDLDEVAPDNPVMLTRCCAHISTHNSMSLKLQGLADDTQDSASRIYSRVDGVIAGTVFEGAHMDAMKAAILSHDELVDAMESANNMLVKEGITSVHDSGGYGFVQMGAIQDAIKADKLKIRLYSMIFSFVDNMQFNESYVASGLHTGFGDAHFRLGPVKLMIDGSSSGPTAATIEAYAIDPNNHGVLSLNQETVSDFIVRAHKAGWQVTCHAVGDAAVTIIVNAIEQAQNECPRPDCRHRIEHCGMVNEELLTRIQKLGIVPICNPIFLYEFGDGYVRNYSAGTSDRMFTAKSFFDRGIVTAGASDCPITFSNPLMGMHLAANRTTQTGQVLNAKECITPMQALRMFTYNGAYVSFEENIKGSIEEGKLADLAVLDQDFTAVAADKIMDIGVDMTFIDGEPVFVK